MGDAEVHDRLDRVRAVRRKLAEHGPASPRADGDFERIALSARDGDLLRDLLLADTAGTVVEIGLAYGSSALAIGEALTHRRGTSPPRHVALDPWQTSEFRDAGWHAIRAAGLDDICTLIRQRSQLALPRLLEEGLTVDAAFVDGSHHFHHVFVDLYFLGQIVRPGGLAALDDCHWPSVATAVRYFERNLAWHPRTIPDSDAGRAGRLHAYRRPDSTPQPSFEDFQPFS